MRILPLSYDRYRAAALRLARTGRLTSVAAASPAAPAAPASTYADLYEQVALSFPPDSSIGDGDFDTIGRIELGALVDAGMQPTSSLFDFGCGTGRLAVHAIPYLTAGSYLGTDIAPTMLVHATGLVTRALGAMPANARFLTQHGEQFPVTEPPDFFCAYSVFTHMEHEDMYRYLCAARLVSAPHTVFVASCLQLDLRDAQTIFLMSAAKTVDQRWAEVRNVVTSQSLFTSVAALAGWTVTDWYGGDTPTFTTDDGSHIGLGQSIAVMRLTEPA